MTRTLTLILFILLGLTHPAFAEHEYAIGISSIPDENSKVPELEAILREAYRRAGFTARFVYLPRLRDLEYANNGNIAASSVRARDAIEDYPNLMCLPTPILVGKVVAFTLNPRITITDREDLRGRPVGVVRGELVADKLAQATGAKVEMVGAYESLFEMLQRGRVDAVLLNARLGALLLRQYGIEGWSMSPPLQRSYYYHVINKMYAPLLAEKLDDAFREMILDGTMKTLAGKYASMIPDAPDADRGQ